ncbi:MAG: ATP-binding cassette domain-containing protein, partial [Pseudomonadota bacterium]
SSLVRALVGLWPPASGSITLDGSRLDQWESAELGRYVGYLPQAVELFDGTVKENIARFRTDGDDAAVITAAKQAHAHDLILGLPDGYDTQLGAYGTHLSAGQRQRVALARALYGNPKLIVLDEPNANLDREGDLALTATMQGCRARGQAVVLVSHRVQAISTADLLVYIDKGLQRAFGPRDEVLAKIQSDQLEPTIDRRVSDRRRTSNGGSNIAQDGERRRGGRRKEDRMSAGSATASSPEPSEG